MSMLLSLRDLHTKLADLHHRSQKEEAEADELVEEVIDGLTLGWKYFYSNRNSTRRELTINGYKFACEIETVPWSIFKDPFTSYWIWTDLPLGRVEDLIAQVPEPLRKFLRPMEEFYPTESEARWNVHCGESLEALIALWRLWEPLYCPDYKPKKPNAKKTNAVRKVHSQG